MEPMEKANTIVDAVGGDTLIIMAVLFAGVLYWAFKPVLKNRHRRDGDNDDGSSNGY